MVRLSERLLKKIKYILTIIVAAILVFFGWQTIARKSVETDSPTFLPQPANADSLEVDSNVDSSPGATWWGDSGWWVGGDSGGDDGGDGDP